MTLSLSIPPVRLLAAFGIAALASTCSAGTPTDARSTPYAAEIRRTAFGVPHIKAKDEAGLGYGLGYAYAEDNLCVLADEIVTVNGERSRYFGPEQTPLNSDTPNLHSDYFYRLINDSDTVRSVLKQQPRDGLLLLQGYVTGYNRYLEKTGVANLPEACRGAAWVRKLTIQDLIKLTRRYAAEGASAHFISAIMAAVPPAASAALHVPAPAGGPLGARAGSEAGIASSATAATAASAAGNAGGAAMARVSAGIERALAEAQSGKAASKPGVLTAEYWKQLRNHTGSNAVALGKDATENGQGMLLANPHFPWRGALRFYQMHLTIPGKLDVMGASLAGLPVVSIGFNQNLAWSHTVNTSQHFNLQVLQLDGANPTSYLLDGERRAMQRKTISVDVLDEDGVVRSRPRDFYSTPGGFAVVIPGLLEWGDGYAYTLNDANLNNHRMLEQWSSMNRASTLAEFKSAIEHTIGLPWVNTLATDSSGNALYMDVTVVPNISAAKQAACVPPPFVPLAQQRVYVLDGSHSACAPDSDPSAPQAGVFPASKLPVLARADFVQNSNDHAWLSNPASPLTGFADIVSRDFDEQNSRTRIGISQLQARLNGSDGQPGKRISVQQLQDMTLGNRVYYAELVMDDVLRICAGDKRVSTQSGAAAEMALACSRLAAWDRKANLESNMGFLYFTGLWDSVERMAGLWAVPFDPADPVNTPRGLKVGDPAVADAVRQALAQAARDVAARGWSPDATWGDIQFAVRGSRKIPMHGGPGQYGIYNAISSEPTQDGVLNVIEGSSYVQTVMFDRNGPQVQAMLSYSQSADPASPHYADQTERFSRKAWITQAFTEAQITADPAYRSITISE
ncbi:acylase [Oxalobacteraceae bacterium]|nr:acylase [Oxalobacteraceae bacterium]